MNSITLLLAAAVAEIAIIVWILGRGRSTNRTTREIPTRD